MPELPNNWPDGDRHSSPLDEYVMVVCLTGVPARPGLLETYETCSVSITLFVTTPAPLLHVTFPVVPSQTDEYM